MYAGITRVLLLKHRGGAADPNEYPTSECMYLARVRVWLLMHLSFVGCCQNISTELEIAVKKSIIFFRGLCCGGTAS